MTVEQIVKLALSQGVTAVLAAIFIYFIFRYFNDRLEILRKRESKEPKPIKFHASGQLTKGREQGPGEFIINIDIVEKKEN